MTKSEQKELAREIGKRLKHFRILTGYSQEDLGRQIGVTFQQIQKYEMGRNRMSTPILCLIARVLNVPIVDFFPADFEGVELSDEIKYASKLAHKIVRIEDRRVRSVLVHIVQEFEEG